jgi:predicted MFS family arabinose efflux permease
MVLMSFIWAIGRNFAFPYFAMYMDGKSGGGGMHFSDPLIGFMIMIGGFSYILMLPISGSLCDRIGRRKMMAVSLFPQLILIPSYAFANSYTEFLLLYALSSGLGAFMDPAFSSMVADLVQPKRREEVYGLSYMINNIATVVCPPIGGMIAGVSGYPILFIYASFFAMTGVAVFLLSVKESRPREVCIAEAPGLRNVFRDRLFILFCFTAAFTNIVYSQLYTLLGVYTTKSAGFEPEFYGILFALNGAMVVTLQIPIRKGAIRLGPTKSFMLAQLLYSVGFAYFMFAVDPTQYLLADAILTIGEITFVPASSGFVANLAPPEMRGRYMALMGLFFSIGAALGAPVVFTLYGGLATADKYLIWGILGLVGFATLPGYVALSRLVRRKRLTEKKV